MERPSASSAALPAACWYNADALAVRVVPWQPAPYRLTLYLLDYDRNGREMAITFVSDDIDKLDTRRVTKQETAAGVYLTWTVTGPVRVGLKKLAGHSAALSGIFIDPIRTEL